MRSKGQADTTAAKHYDGRLEDLIVAANTTGFTLDYLEGLTAGLPQDATLKVIKNLAGMDPEVTYTKRNQRPRMSGYDSDIPF